MLLHNSLVGRSAWFSKAALQVQLAVIVLPLVAILAMMVGIGRYAPAHSGCCSCLCKA